MLFAIYGIGFFALTGLIGMLYLRALRAADRLLLNARERILTISDIVSFGVLAGTGLVSATAAAFLPPYLGVWAGFFYATLPVTMPIAAIRFARRAERVTSD